MKLSDVIFLMRSFARIIKYLRGLNIYTIKYHMRFSTYFPIHDNDPLLVSIRGFMYKIKSIDITIWLTPAIHDCTNKYLLFPRIQRHMNYNACCCQHANHHRRYGSCLKSFVIDSFGKNIIVGHRRIALRSYC